MTVTIKEILESKGIQAKEEHLMNLEQKWAGMQQLRKNLDDILRADADIAIRNIPGGEEDE